MDFHFRDINPSMIAAWRTEFSGDESVTVSLGQIFDVSADAIVSPANSFGFMDGGIDLVYSEHFGWNLEKRLRAHLVSDYLGELPVGCAVVVPTESSAIPWLISAPTMRVPMDVSRTPNAYLAFRAVLHCVQRHNRGSSEPIHSVLCPGLGTAIGRMAPTTCARQMRAALDDFRRGGAAVPTSLGAAVKQHIELTEGDHGGN